MFVLVFVFDFAVIEFDFQTQAFAVPNDTTQALTRPPLILVMVQSPCFALPCLALSCLALTCLVLSGVVLPCLALSCDFVRVLSCFVVSCSCPV
jgi:hypothetical protein